MDFIWILFAFLCGLGVRLISLPPMLGYLLAGFLLNFMHMQPDEHLDTLSDLGITLMLFTIGLKLNIKDLIKPEVWASTLLHMPIWILITTSLFWWLGTLALPHLTDMSLKTAALLAFALSFSSTVCIVKLLENSGETLTRHGKLAISILVIQDILAVIFLVIANGKIPSIWAFALLSLFLLKPLFNKFLDYAGHGELLPLTGIFLALGAYQLFEFVDVKGDLGALIFGMILSHHKKATELTKALLSLKDLFLIGFFLTIGLTALPTWSMVWIILIISALLTIKFLLFFFVFVGLKLRGRTAFLASVELSNVSEFGLIVCALCVNQLWLDKEWLVILAIALFISFIITSIVYKSAHQIYARYKHFLCRFQTQSRLPDDIFEQPEHCRVLIVGMGRVGKGAYQALQEEMGKGIWGMDADRSRVAIQKKAGFKIFAGDGGDADLWEHFHFETIEFMLLTIPKVDDICNITTQVRNSGYQGHIIAICRYEDEFQTLLDAGADKVFNFFSGAGAGLAEESLHYIEYKKALARVNPD